MVGKNVICATLIMLCMVVSACTTASSVTATREASKTTTVVALTEMEAEQSEAEVVMQISVTVRQLATGEELDGDEIRAVVIKAIRDEFDGASEALLVSLGENVTNIVLAELKDRPLITDETIRLYVVAASEGVEQGAKIYIASLGNDPVETLRSEPVKDVEPAEPEEE